MDHNQMDIAIKLLAKAQSTTYDAEAVSLVRRSCLILTGVATRADEEADHTKKQTDACGVWTQDTGSDFHEWQPKHELVTPNDCHFDLTA